MSSATTDQTEARPHQLKYLYVVLLLLFLIIARPILPAGFIHQIAVLAIAFVAWITLGKGTKARIILAVLVVPALFGIVGRSFVPFEAGDKLSEAFEGALLFLACALLFYSACNILISLLLTKHVVADDILGAISLYLIIGYMFAFLYSAIELFSPDSFVTATALPEPMEGQGRGLITSRFVYFSFITLASQGYGDMTPRNELAESAVILETIVGQLYIALVIAYLLSVHVAQRLSEKNQ